MRLPLPTKHELVQAHPKGIGQGYHHVDGDRAPSLTAFDLGDGGVSQLRLSLEILLAPASLPPELLAPEGNESANQRRGRFKGVYQPKKTWRWCASIAAGEVRPNSKRKRVHLGSYDTPEEAAEAYDLAALQNYGEFAALNFPGKRARYVELLRGPHAG